MRFIADQGQQQHQTAAHTDRRSDPARPLTLPLPLFSLFLCPPLFSGRRYEVRTSPDEGCRTVPCGRREKESVDWIRVKEDATIETERPTRAEQSHSQTRIYFPSLFSSLLLFVDPAGAGRGIVHVLDAYCPHLGANMGHGGKVRNEQS